VAGRKKQRGTSIRHCQRQLLRDARTPEFIPPFTGCILGTAVGDALGLPYEGLSPRRAARLFPHPDRYHFLPFGRGMCSDDTEHTLMVAQALIESAGYCMADDSAEPFRRRLAWSMRLWLLGLPAGIGMATLKGILKLWLFLPRRWQGVYSAGNGAAMRSALLGVFWGDEQPRMLSLHLAACTRLTHTDPKAEQAAMVVAQAAHASFRGAGRVEPLQYAVRMRALLGSEGAELAGLIDRAAASAAAGEDTPAFARALGLERGVTGYALHTVPVALHAWLAHPGDYRGAVLAAIACGGDTDTVAAITGAIAGAGGGAEAIPPQWLARLAESPRDVAWMKSVALRLAEVRASYISQAGVAEPLVIYRNLKFLVVVLLHGLRRLLPPY
jgi:ADP-ribosyl-[dinitrogen reductase] hydrolase